MKKMEIYSCRSDLGNDNIIYFNNLNNEDMVINKLVKELSIYFKMNHLNKNSHLFIVGLGNDNHTSDSVGPKTLKYINVNAYLENIGIKLNKVKVSALEPGTMGETGIKTEKTIKSIVNIIKPDLVILIDSIICDDIKFLNKSIQLNDKGITPGSGLSGFNFKIDSNTLKTPTIVIGVTTAIEIKFNNNENNIPYLLSTKDIDTYVDNISRIIGISINKAIDEIN